MGALLVGVLFRAPQRRDNTRLQAAFSGAFGSEKPPKTPKTQGSRALHPVAFKSSQRFG
jgi:hypothetical protein